MEKYGEIYAHSPMYAYFPVISQKTTVNIPIYNPENLP